MCSYHGWRFQGDGACTKIPQALDEKANSAACSNSKSCAVSHPTQVRTCVGFFSRSCDGFPSDAYLDMPQYLEHTPWLRRWQCELLRW